ncbi:magnesium/cobalt transporter CorA [Brevibacillus dissolubilis]|uniref:magnesium/cobalt transporter CorA n=1 Tax=Brevibacillus dissolubilis TaxID=1844116 RepID=UPI001115DF77|nr:magnesium/cobalt transporter CorA [Brevibacillus dissolubilis]
MKIRWIRNGLIQEIDDIEMTLTLPDNGFYWIDAKLFDLDILQRLFRLHPLAVEDCIDEEEQRPKLEIYHDHYFIVLNSIQFRNQDIFLREVNIFLGRHHIITVSKADIHEFTKAVTIIREGELNSPDYLLYHLVDEIVESYFDVMESIENLIEDLEEDILVNAKKSHLNELIGLRSEILYAKKMLGPQRDLIGMLNKKELDLIDDNLQKYFIDIHENSVKVVESFDTFRELIGNLREAYQSAVSNRTNEIMRVFTALTTIFMPLTIVTGIYGMNFEFMPELRSPYGYYGVLSFMLLLAVTMYWIFKKKQWL